MVGEEEVQFCPICQVPFAILRIIYAVHVNMCDVVWDALPDCSDSIECRSESVFHYRDFSHRTMATHRENLRKRRIEEANDVVAENQEKLIEERPFKVSRLLGTIKIEVEEDEDGDNIFLNTSSQKYNEDIDINNSDKNLSKKQFLKSMLNTNRDISRYNSLTMYNKADLCKTITKNHVSARGIELKQSESGALVKPEKVDVNEYENVRNKTVTKEIPCKGESVCDDLEGKINESVEKKEKCKIEWNNLFNKNRSTSALKVEDILMNKNKHSVAKPVRVCPSFKKMPETDFAVDAFQFGNISGVNTYFLSHFHADHYMGLRKTFSNPIYCSLITANLVKKKLRVNEKFIHVLPLNKPVGINGVEVTCFDANHCPGAVMILFRLINGSRYLHVGDFRASLEMETIPQLQNAHIDRLYLDTTYFNPEYIFPPQKEVVDKVKEIVSHLSQKHDRALFIAGTYSIGKEKVFLGMLEALKCKLWAQSSKMDIFRCVNNEVILSALTNNPSEAKIHVLPMNYLYFDRLKKYLLDMNGIFTHIFAFKPTGWEIGRKVGKDWLNVSCNENITIYGVPYSEHSNYEELCRFIKFIKATQVIPTVPMKNREMYGVLKSIVDSYKTGPKQQSIQNFMKTTLNK